MGHVSLKALILCQIVMIVPICVELYKSPAPREEDRYRLKVRGFLLVKETTIAVRKAVAATLTIAFLYKAPILAGFIC